MFGRVRVVVSSNVPVRQRARAQRERVPGGYSTVLWREPNYLHEESGRFTVADLSRKIRVGPGRKPAVRAAGETQVFFISTSSLDVSDVSTTLSYKSVFMYVL